MGKQLMLHIEITGNDQGKVQNWSLGHRDVENA
jgi:hypothetical protein